MENIKHDDQVYDLVDVIIKKARALTSFTFTELLTDVKRTTGTTYSVYLIRDAARLMESLEYCSRTPKVPFILTALGREIKDIGGYQRYLQQLKKNEIEATEKESITLENLLSSTEVNKYLMKTRWLPHIFSAIALIVSIITLVKDCSGTEKDTVEKVEPVNKNA